MTGVRAALLAFGLATGSACATPPSAPRPLPRVTLDAHVREIHALTFSPNGALFASAGGGANPAVDEITLWTTDTGSRRMTFANYTGVAATLAFSPDGKLLAAGATDGRITLLDVDSGTERSSFTGTAGRVSALGFAFDGKVLVSVVQVDAEDEAIEVCRWDVDRSVARSAFRPGASSPVALSPGAGTLAWIAPGKPSSIWTTNLETQEKRLVSNVGIVRGDTMAYSPDGRRLAAVHYESWSPFPNRCPYVYLVEAQTGRIQVRSPRPFDARRGLAISHDARLLARGVDGGFELWDLKTPDVRATVSEPSSKSEGAELVAFSPDDRTLISSDGRGMLFLWDVPKLLGVSDGAAP
jgi:WD40 repeat protein